MRRVTATLKAYEFSELPKNIQLALIKRAQEYAQEYLEATPITESMLDALVERGFSEENGFSNLNVYWSLCYSQGDGVGITGTIDALKWIKTQEKEKEYAEYAHLLKTINAYSGELILDIARHNIHYCHKNTFSVDCDRAVFSNEIYNDEFQMADRELGLLCRQLTHLLRDESEKLEKIGYKEIAYQTSEAVAIESLEQDEYSGDGSLLPSYFNQGS